MRFFRRPLLPRPATPRTAGTFIKYVGPVIRLVLGEKRYWTNSQRYRRKAGALAGFTCSEANTEAGAEGVVWTEDDLFKYLENPAAFMPGNKKVLAGVKNETDRGIKSPISSSS